MASEDGNLPAARDRFHHAIDALIRPTGQYVDSKWAAIPSIYQQLRAAIPGEQGAGNHAARSMPPLWIDASHTLTKIDTQVAKWQPATLTFIGPLRPGWCRLNTHEPATVTRLKHLSYQTWRPQDVSLLDDRSGQLEAWVKEIENLLTPPRKWTLPNPCPVCGVAVVYKRDSAGEMVRQPALQVGPLGCFCANQKCRAAWSPDYFDHLRRLLNMPLPEGVLA